MKNSSITKLKRSNHLKEIHQLLPTISYGDGVSNHCLSIRDHLQTLGYRSEIYVLHHDKHLKNNVKLFKRHAINKKAGLFYHYAIGSELTSYFIKYKGPKCLIYHNITPPEFYNTYNPDVAGILENGLTGLKKLSLHAPLSVGDSYFNVSDLLAYGFKNPFVMPISVSPASDNTDFDSDLDNRLNDGKANLIFVGRIAPNKKQDDLIKAFNYYLTMDSSARLIIVGSGEPTDPYFLNVKNEINKYNLNKDVILTGHVTNQELETYYRNADLFWSMSEHEGFGIPLVESMWHNVPVLAFKSSAVPETLGNAGIMFTSKNDLLSIAALAKIMVRDETLRKKVLKSQAIRRQDFLPESVWPHFSSILKRMETYKV